ncbi:MAG: AAA family ATPase [Clostridiales bacterium]|nr:AAA family ATPase [Clostridiales bacterium]
MAKKNILITDGDASYLENFERFLRNNHSDKFIINTAANSDGVRAFVDNYDRKVDILLISPDAYTDRIKSCASVIMILSNGVIPIQLEKYPVIKKYQSGDAIVHSISHAYTEAMPDEFDISQINGDCEIIGVFSPIGGSGKTTVASLLAAHLAAKKKVLFFSMEQFQYTEYLFSGSSRYNMSDFLYFVHKGDNDLLANLNRMLITDVNLNVNFLNSPLCFVDLNKIECDKWAAFLRALAQFGLFNKVVIDMPSHLNDQILEVLSACNKVITPVLDDQMSVFKLNRLIHDLTQIDNEILLNKFIYVLNKYNGFQPHTEVNIFATLPAESEPLLNLAMPDIKRRPFWGELAKLSSMLEEVRS